MTLLSSPCLIVTISVFQGGQNEQAVDTILTATDRLFSSVGDAHEMVKQAKMLAQVMFRNSVLLRPEHVFLSSF